MISKLHQHLSIAFKAALYAFNRSYCKGETIEEILGYTDAMTSLPNRKAFEIDRNNMHVFETFILIDVDDLKFINDAFGHLFGDSILRSCAQILSKAVQKVGKAYRLGGDEFALVVPQCWVRTVCLDISNRIKDDGRFTISIGIAPPCGAEGFTDELFNTAETELYRSKREQNSLDSHRNKIKNNTNKNKRIDNLEDDDHHISHNQAPKTMAATMA